MSDKLDNVNAGLAKVNAGLTKVVYPIVAGVWISLIGTIMGIIECIILPLIPFGICWFKIVYFAFWPFNKVVVKKENAGGLATLGNVLWIIFNGWMVAILFALFWAAMLFTPGDKQLDKVFAYAFLPFGKRITKV